MIDDIKHLVETVMVGFFARRFADKLEKIVELIREMRRENLEREDDENDYKQHLNGELVELEGMAANAATLAGWVHKQVEQGDTGPLLALASALREAEDDE